MSEESPKKQDKPEQAGDEEVEPAVGKRQKTGDAQEAKVSPAKADARKTKKHVVAEEEDDDDEEFEGAGEADDSFDSDFDDPEGGNEAENEEFDLEAYKKWNAEHG